MGKAAARKRTTIKNSDPGVDALAMYGARNMLVANMMSMGWRLAIMVLLPIFIGVQLDKRFDSEPSLTLAAFFISIFGASMLIYRTFNELTTQAALEDAKKNKRKKTVTRKTNV